MRERQIELFVPGRLCLLGEHSDWAGLYRITNSAIAPGEAIVTGIEQGIYAVVSPAKKFIIKSDIDEEVFECDMNTEALKQTAADGGYFSYVAGVASYINEYYSVGGLEIRITKMDLPVKSGLSSSAAICVLAARAFNLIYDLKMSIIGEMEVAFLGEQRTLSRCGRLDQACAYGVKPVHMRFDGSRVETCPLKLKSDLYYVYADLNSSKDTIKILSDLNRCFPFAQNEIDKNVQMALGEDNRMFVKKAVECIETGDIKKLGETMNLYQENFDKKVAPACPSQLTAPVLHSVLSDANIDQYVYGCKGVGSQGDGTVQFLAKNEECQRKLIDYLKCERKMNAFPLTLRPQQSVRKAIIPVAGFGTRVYPASKCIKKPLLPIVDKDGMLKPALVILLEELIQSGIEEICLIIGPEDKDIYEMLFCKLADEYYNSLSEEKQQYENHLIEIGKKITYVYQNERKGFGHAVFQSADFASGEPVLLLLGDMIYESYIGKNCSKQLIEAYEKYEKPIVSIHEVPLQDVVNYGIMHGVWMDEKENSMLLNKIVEKPTVELAKDSLKMVVKNSEEQYFAVFGQYILTKEVYDELEENIQEKLYLNEEIQLTSSLEKVREKFGMIGYKIQGKSFDIGLPEKYAETMLEFGGRFFDKKGN